MPTPEEKLSVQRLIKMIMEDLGICAKDYMLPDNMPEDSFAICATLDELRDAQMTLVNLAGNLIKLTIKLRQDIGKMEDDPNCGNKIASLIEYYRGRSMEGMEECVHELVSKLFDCAASEKPDTDKHGETEH